MLCLACSFSFLLPPNPQPAQHFAFESFCPCIIFSHFPCVFPLLLCFFLRRKWLAGKPNAFGLVLERSQLLQVSKFARAWHFLKKQGGGAVSYFTFSPVAMDACKWWLFATQKGSRELPASLAAVCFVLRSVIAPEHLKQLQLQLKDQITLHFSPSKRSTTSFSELTPRLRSAACRAMSRNSRIPSHTKSM